jgi:hypothetical protein
MKLLLLFILSFSVKAQTSPVRATPQKILDEVMRRVDAIFSDTIDEGELNADVIKEKSNCITRLINPSKKTYRHFCKLAISLEGSLSDETEVCEARCDINFFSANLDLRSLNYNDSQMYQCLEQLSSGCD